MCGGTILYPHFKHAPWECHESILGLLHFSIDINDLPSVCNDVDLIMYADDTVFFTH